MAGLKPSGKLGGFSLTNIVVGDMIGAGIFTTSGLLLAQLHDPRLLLILWALGGAIALTGALSYGELGAAFPRAGGDYAFLSELWGPLPGFLSGWVSFFAGFSAPMAASSLAFSTYLLRTLPEAPGSEDGLLVKLIAIGIIMLFTLLHYLGLRSGTGMQNVLTVIKVLLIVSLIGGGFLFGEGSMQHFRLMDEGSASSSSFRSMGLALMWITFAYTGWNASTYVGSEVRNPARNIPRSLLTGTCVVTGLYLLLNILFVYALQPAEMEGVIAVGGASAEALFGRSLDRLFSLFIALILLSAISVLIMIGPRVYYAMAKSGHFFPLAGRTNRAGVPGTAILLQSGLAVLYVLTGTFEQIITFLSFSLGIFPILAVAGVFRLRRQGKSVVRMPGYPLLPSFFILISTLILVLAFLERPLESGIALGLVGAGVFIYYFAIRNR